MSSLYWSTSITHPKVRKRNQSVLTYNGAICHVNNSKTGTQSVLILTSQLGTTPRPFHQTRQTIGNKPLSCFVFLYFSVKIWQFGNYSTTGIVSGIFTKLLRYSLSNGIIFMSEFLYGWQGSKESESNIGPGLPETELYQEPEFKGAVSRDFSRPWYQYKILRRYNSAEQF